MLLLTTTKGESVNTSIEMVPFQTLPRGAAYLHKGDLFIIPVAGVEVLRYDGLKGFKGGEPTWVNVQPPYQITEVTPISHAALR